MLIGEHHPNVLLIHVSALGAKRGGWAKSILKSEPNLPLIVLAEDDPDRMPRALTTFIIRLRAESSGDDSVQRFSISGASMAPDIHLS